MPAFRDLGRALRATGAEVVVLASPPSTHRPLSELALAEGCHVISEKPLALDLADARAIAAAADGGRPPRDGGPELPLPAPVPRAPRPRPGRRARGAARGPDRPAAATCASARISRRDWRGRMPHPYLLDMAIHHVDMLRMITGSEIVEVDARGWRAPDSPFKHDPSVGALLTLAGRDAGRRTTAPGRSRSSRRRGTATGSSSARRAARRGPAASTTRSGASSGSAGTASRRVRVALPLLPAVDRPGVLAELRRALAEGVAPETSARRQRPQPRARPRDRPLDRGAPARPPRGGPRGVKIGLFLALYLRSAARGGARRRRRRGLRGGRARLDGAELATAARQRCSATDPAARAGSTAAVAERGLAISGALVSRQPAAPRSAVAAAADRDYRDTVRLAAEIGIATVVTFSGCPGESERSLRPSWITCSWPTDFPETLDWQWDERVLPYWDDAAAFARARGVSVAIEPHPGFVVYNTRLDAAPARGRGRRRGRRTSILRISSGRGWTRSPACPRSRVRSSTCTRRTRPSWSENLALNGVLEPLPSDRPADRSWTFRSVGEGHPVSFWRDLAVALQDAGYDERALDRARGPAALPRGRARRCRPHPPRGARCLRRSRSPSGSTSARPASRASRSRRTEPSSRVAEEGYPLSTPQRRLVGAGSGGLVAREPRAVLARLADAARRLEPRSPASGSRARCTASSPSTRRDRVIRPAILWNDQRTEAECAEIEERIGLDRLIALTGNRALTGFTAPKLLWLRRHEPESYARIARVLLPKDYVRLRLTGEWATDVADASGTLLLDVARRSLVGGGARRARAPARVAAAGARVAGGQRRRRAPATECHEESLSRPARATAPPRPSASASTVRGRSRS